MSIRTGHVHGTLTKSWTCKIGGEGPVPMRLKENNVMQTGYNK